MRVLHVIKGLGPGGAERLLVWLARARSSDVEVDVAYVLPHKAHLVAELEEAGAGVYCVSGRRGLADPRWPRRLVELVRRLRPDIVHLHSPAVAAVTRLLLRPLPSRPVLVSTEHNLWPSFAPATRTLNGLTLGMGDATFAVSDEVRGSIWRRWRPGVDVVIQGIPATTLWARRGERATVRAALGITDDTVLVATVANFREKKDYPTLLAAAAQTVDEPRLQFISIGQGPLEAELHALHDRLGLGDRFRFLGFHPDPPAVLAGSDVFALTSRHEGLPISLLEAMALGLAPVVTTVGGIPEVVTDGVNGILLPPGDPTRLARALRRLAGDPEERATIGAAALVRSGDFDIAHTQRELEDHYRRLLEPRAG